MPLANQLDVEQFGQVDFSNEPEGAVTAYLNSAQALVEQYCARTFEDVAPGGDITVGLDGKLRRHLYLPRVPIITITSVTEDGTALVEGTDYLANTDAGVLTRISGGDTSRLIQWTRNRYHAATSKGVEVVYTGGYDPATNGRVAGEPPMDLRMVVAQVAGRIFRAAAAWAATPAGAGPLQSIDMDGPGSATFGGSVADIGLKQIDSASLLPDEKRALSRYRRREYAR